MKALIYLGVFLSLSAAIMAVYNRGGDDRETKIRLEIAIQNNQAFEKAYNQIVELQKQLQESENEIIHEPQGEVRPSDPVIRRYYERLRVRRNAEK